MHNPGQLALMDKNELIELMEELFPEGWKSRLAEKAQVHKVTVSRWFNGKVNRSWAIEKACRQMIHQEECVRRNIELAKA